MDSSPPRKPPLLNNWLLLFMFAMILANIGGSMYGPLLSVYLKDDLKADIAQIGLFFTLVQLFSLVLQIFGGWVSDSLGRLRSVAIASVAGVFSYIALILAPTWQWMLLGEGLNAVTRSLVAPSYGAFIAEQTAEENRSRVFGITETLFMIVTIVGPPLGGYIASSWGFRPMLACSGLLYLGAAIVRVAMARAAAKGHEANPRRLELSNLKSNLWTMGGLLLAGGVLTWILVTDSIRDIAYSLSFNLMPIYLKDTGGLTIQQIGWLQSIFGICNMAINVPAGILADRKGERLAIVAGFITQFVAFMVFLQARTFLGFAVAWGMLGIGVALMAPAYQSLASKVIPENLRGTAFGLLQSSVGIFAIPAPTIGSFLWDRFGPLAPFRLTSGLVLAAILPVWLKFKTPAKETPTDIEPAALAAEESISPG